MRQPQRRDRPAHRDAAPATTHWYPRTGSSAAAFGLGVEAPVPLQTAQQFGDARLLAASDELLEREGGQKKGVGFTSLMPKPSKVNPPMFRCLTKRSSPLPIVLYLAFGVYFLSWDLFTLEGVLEVKPEVGQVYAVLRKWVVGRSARPQTYSQLSHDYHVLTGEWFEPHGSWDAPLGELNNLLASGGAPALSALVILNDTKEPGDGFWGCAPNVPPRPKKEIDRLAVWARIVDEIGKFNWPASLP